MTSWCYGDVVIWRNYDTNFSKPYIYIKCLPRGMPVRAACCKMAACCNSANETPWDAATKTPNIHPSFTTIDPQYKYSNSRALFTEICNMENRTKKTFNTSGTGAEVFVSYPIVKVVPVFVHLMTLFYMSHQVHNSFGYISPMNHQHYKWKYHVSVGNFWRKKQTVTERIFPSSHLVHFVSAFLSSWICCLSHTFTRPKGLLCFLALPNSSKFFQKQLLSIFKRLRSLNLKRGANWGLYRLVSLLQSMLQWKYPQIWGAMFFQHQEHGILF